MKKKLLVAIVILAAFVGLDASRRPSEQLTAGAAVYMLTVYKQHISPLFSGAVQCRFMPTCSEYSSMAIKKYGIAEGSWLSVKRLARCSAWSDEGGKDYP